MSKLLALALVLLISVGTLAGSTIAWFTDSVTSGNNIIKSGTLEVELFTSTDNQNWSEVKDGSGPIYNYQYWEPGYTDLRLFEIKNAGSLAFRYKLDIRPSVIPQPGEADLAEVIDVYCIPVNASFQLPEKFSDITAEPVGTLAELVAAASDPDGAIHGVILPENGADNAVPPESDQDIAATGSQKVCIALHMQESAGNEYQGLSIGEGFSLQLLATQYTYENDSFGNGYDAGSKYASAGVMTMDELQDALTNNINPIKLGCAFPLNDTIEIPYDVTINGNGFTLFRGTKENGDPFTGTMFTVGSGSTLTLEDVKLDGGAVWTGEIDPTLRRGTVNSGVTATGNLIATGNNSHIVLNEGAILENNDGAYAVHLGIRIGATLTLNGGKIINNSSGSGAIWGGGHITVNSGSISGNSSSGIAGAIRMVSDCNLTMNGGEISNNKAAGDGGAIWGYGSSTYTFSGGKMSNNESAGTGGAIYTGTYSVINISGGFELCDNKAANSGAIRLTDHTSLTMTGGKVSGNTQNGESNAFNTWNNSISITGGEIADNFSYVGGLGLAIGEADIDGVISYNLSTNHNTAYLAAKFNGFKFKVNETSENFANFNFKPAEGYTYTAGDENKLVCMTEGYKTYWDAANGTFRLRAK